MKKIVIDTNMLISFVTDRNQLQQDKVSIIFEAAKRSQLTVICHQNVITEFVYVLDRVYSAEKSTIQTMLGELLEMPGVELTNDLDYTRLLKIWPDKSPDYGDAVLLAYCKEHKDTRLATFDRKLVKISQQLGVKMYETILH